MLKLKLQYFGHLMQRVDSLGKTLMLGGIGGRRRRGRQRMRWLDGITDSMVMNERKVKSLSRVQLFATPWTVCSPPDSSVHGILQARILEWVAISFSGELVSKFFRLMKVILRSTSSVHFSRSVVSDSLRPHDRSTPGHPVHHHRLEFTQTHVHRVSDDIQPSHPLLSPSPPAPNPSQHQSLSQ